MKNKSKKITTIDELAVMMNNSFQTAQDHIDVRFDKVEGRLDKVELRLDRVEDRLGKVEGRLTKVEIRLDNIEEEVSEIRKHQAMHTIFRDEFERLDNRVKKLEKLLIKG